MLRKCKISSNNFKISGLLSVDVTVRVQNIANRKNPIHPSALLCVMNDTNNIHNVNYMRIGNSNIFTQSY